MCNNETPPDEYWYGYEEDEDYDEFDEKRYEQITAKNELLNNNKKLSYVNENE